MLSKTNTAIVHDWFYTNGGAEKCVRSFINILPQAQLYGLFDFLTDEARQEIIGGRSVRTSFIQHLPAAKGKHRKYLPLFPLAVEQLDLAEHELILSSSASIAKGVLINANQLHICYCHSPMRYAWDLYYNYLKEANLTTGVIGWLAKYYLYRIRQWDVAASHRVDHYIANSKYIANRIWRVYRRPSTVIYPPVDTANFELQVNKSDFYLTASRLVSYKRMDLIVEAFSAMPDKKLVVIGEGPNLQKVKQKAGKNIHILGHQPFSVLKQHMQEAKAFVFAAEEDFGIIPVEAQACGTPIIAFGKGGALETVVNGETGVFFYEQTVSAIQQAVKSFESKENSFDSHLIRQNAMRFNKTRYEEEISGFLANALEEFKAGGIRQINYESNYP